VATLLMYSRKQNKRPCLERNDSGKQQALQLLVAVLGNPGLIHAVSLKKIQPQFYKASTDAETRSTGDIFGLYSISIRGATVQLNMIDGSVYCNYRPGYHSFQYKLVSIQVVSLQVYLMEV